jgi:hypothetical protein
VCYSAFENNQKQPSLGEILWKNQYQKRYTAVTFAVKNIPILRTNYSGQKNISRGFVQAVGMTRINIGIMAMGRAANMESAWKKN